VMKNWMNFWMNKFYSKFGKIPQNNKCRVNYTGIFDQI
jgi:hypothetical protein